MKFTRLYHLMNEEDLRECFQRLRKDAAKQTDSNFRADRCSAKI